MNIKDKQISITSYKCDMGNDKLTEIIINAKYPIETEYYTYGLINNIEVEEGTIFTLAVLLNSPKKELIEKNGIFEIVEKPSKILYTGNIFSLKDKKIIGLVNSNKLVLTVLKNLIAPHELIKLAIPEDNYVKLYKNSLIKTSYGLVLKKSYKDYKMNIRSETLDEQELNDIFGTAEIDSFSFNGRIFQEREISFKINKSGNIILYNSSKNPLDWDDIFNFMINNVYK